MSSTKQSKKVNRKCRPNGVKSRVRPGPPRLARGHLNPAASFPQSRSGTFAYGDNYELTNGAGVGAIQVWRANCLFDPDYTNVGHQPRGFDQLLSADGPYTRFCVSEGELTCIFRNEAADFGLVGIHYSTDFPVAGDFSDFAEVLERAQTVWKPIAPAGTPGHIVEIRCRVPIATLLGRSGAKALREDDDTCGSYNASPTRQVAVCAFVVNDSVNADCTVAASYQQSALLFGRSQLPSS